MALYTDNITRKNNPALGFLVYAALIVLFARVVIIGDDPVFGVANSALVFVAISMLIFGGIVPFGTYHIFYLFSLISFGLVPAIEYATRTVYQSKRTDIFQDYTTVTLICTICMFVFHAAYHFAFNKKADITTKLPQRWRIGIRAWVLVLASALVSFMIYAYNNYSLSSVMFRGGEFSSRIETESYIGVTFRHCVYLVPAISLAMYIMSKEKKILPGVILVVLFLLANPLTGLPRYQAGTIAFVLMVALFPRLLQHRNIIIVLVLSGFLLVFPLLNQFRHYKGDEIQIKSDSAFLSEGHFDNFQNLVDLRNRGIVTYGRQLLGVATFFIPRKVWPEKPTGSAVIYAEAAGFRYTNVSMNIIGEGYINFGHAGIILFIVVAGLICGKYDQYFWTKGYLLKNVSGIYYFYFVPLLLFLFRGDLLSSSAYTIGTLIAIISLWFGAVRRT